jgi:hypothetical protein
MTRKIFFLAVLAAFFYILFTPCTFADSMMDGVPARLLALGRVDSVLPDSASMFDLYEEGFASGILERDRQNMISLSPLASVNHQKYNINRGSDQFTFNFMDDKNNYINCWLDDNDVIVVKPYYFYTGEVEYHSSNMYSWNKFFGGEIQYASRIDKNITTGAMFRYAVYNKEFKVSSFTTSDGTVLSGIYMWASKPEFLADLCYKISDSLSIALSAGHKQGLLGNIKTLPGNDSIASFSNIAAFSGYESNISSPPDNTKNEFDARGINIGAGAAYRINNVIEALLTFGAILDRSYTGSVMANNTGYDSLTGTEYDASFKFRYHAGENLIFAAAALGTVYDYAYHRGFVLVGMPVSGRNTDFQVLVSGGASYTDGTFSVPLELFAETGSAGGYYIQKYAGVRGGAEYNLSKLITLRLGCNWPFLMEKLSGITAVSDIEATGGIAIKTELMDLAVGAGYTVYDDININPHATMDRRNWDVRLDVKIPL